MRAIQVKEYGNPAVLQISDVSKPTVKADEVLIQLKCAGVNYIDIYMRKGIPLLAPPVPYIPGLEGAGIVQAIGSDVTGFKQGDRVAYVGPLGAYAEYAVVPAWQLIPLPAEMSFEQGAAFPLQAITAHYLTHDYFSIKPGVPVLVHAAAGGLGLLLVQWLKHLGAFVIGTVSSEEKKDFAKKAGADEVIVYTKEDFVPAVNKMTNDKGVSYILDGVGKDTFTKNLEIIQPRGWISLFGMASGLAETLLPNMLQGKSITVSGLNLIHHMATPAEINQRASAVLDGIKQGWLKLTIGHTYPLADAAQAHRDLESRESHGKLILLMK